MLERKIGNFVCEPRTMDTVADGGTGRIRIFALFYFGALLLAKLDTGILPAAWWEQLCKKSKLSFHHFSGKIKEIICFSVGGGMK